MLTVKLNKSDKLPRILKKHPWVFLDELSHHIKSVQPGFPVRLVDQDSRFIAYGIGNPQSQIAFRAWSFNEADSNFYTPDFLINRLTQLWKFRLKLGFHDSFRVCFSEGDTLSGIIVDRYLLKDKSSQILVFQFSTAAFEIINPDIGKFVESWLSHLKLEYSEIPSFTKTAIIVRRSQSFAEVENLKDKKAVEVIQSAGIDLSNAQILYSRYPYSDSEYQVPFESDFIDGQKTGLFLDQSYNIGLAARWARALFSDSNKVIKILDLCCYRGAWSGHLSQYLGLQGLAIEAHLLDQSERALQHAVKNVSPFAKRVVTHQGDVMTLLDTLSEVDFDIIVSDPPAFAKGKKALGSALEGYYHLNRKALKLGSPEFLFVACSCSSVVTIADFQKVIERSLLTQSSYQIQYLGSGGHALDHTVQPYFPEGEYLKMRGYWLRNIV